MPVKDWILEGKEEIADLQRQQLQSSPVTNIDELTSYLSNDLFFSDIWYWTRKLFVSSTGNVGLTDVDFKPDDGVYLLQGCSVPVVLRPWKDGFKVMFEIYLDGVMFGEAMDGVVEDDWKDINLY